MNEELRKINCPMKDHAQEAVALGRDLFKSIRRIRKVSRACSTCEMGSDCAFLEYFHQQVDIALKDVVSEWGLGGRQGYAGWKNE